MEEGGKSLEEPPKLSKPPNQVARLEQDPSHDHHLRAKKHSCASQNEKTEKENKKKLKN